MDPKLLEAYGAFNISLINDIPLFIDPFLLFGSEKEEYQKLHEDMLTYLRFLRSKAMSSVEIDEGLLRSWYCFPEVKQNWFGFCKCGNCGSGLGIDFARALHGNLGNLFNDFGDEQITQTSHLEKLCIIKDGVGRDNISDFTANLIKRFLLKYTEKFVKENVDESLVGQFTIPKVSFDYDLERWQAAKFTVPLLDDDFVLLTPIDILTKDDTWINAGDMSVQFEQVVESVPDGQLRAEINNYLAKVLPDDPTPKDEREAISKVYRKYATLLDYYIRHKEDHAEEARKKSLQNVSLTESFFVQQISELIGLLHDATQFYSCAGDTYDEAMQRVLFLKDVIENKDGYRLFYVDGKPVQKEEDLQILYRLTWFATPSDVNREVNNGRGPVDFKIARGAKDKSLVEFKLARNTQLKRNLKNQVSVYEKANNTDKSIKCILYFSDTERRRVEGILRELRLSGEKSIVLVDASRDNKTAASRA